ncbi:MAG TPA: hypothetical protein VK638_16285, partial [Edaphobacter sp.]|nr:hypothetical protein [Edaphobacter sp.]
MILTVEAGGEIFYGFERGVDISNGGQRRLFVSATHRFPGSDTRDRPESSGYRGWIERTSLIYTYLP